MMAVAIRRRRRRMAENCLITDWKMIVGKRVAAICLPERLDDHGQLHVVVAPADAHALQHLEPKVLERIATVFGRRAVTRLKIRIRR